MKIYFLIAVAFLIRNAFAQPDNPDNLRSKMFALHVKTVPSEDLKLPFQSIKIIDSRPDTSKVGFRITGRFATSTNNVFEKIALTPGTQKGIENFYAEYYQKNFTPNGNTLLISMKKLWINNLPDRQGGYQRKNINKSSQQDIYVKFEYYLGSVNTYFPMKRLDTIFQLKLNSKNDDYDPTDESKLPFFCFALEKMVENIEYPKYLKDLEKKKPMTIEEIKIFNDKANAIPILIEPVKKGVFITFNEFKNNQPSVTNFSKRKILKRKIYEIADEKGNAILSYFAYYDGDKLAISKRLADLSSEHVKQDNYEIYKVSNSFQFFEPHFLNVYQSTVVNNRAIPVYYPGRNFFLVPRQIDLETGEIY